MLERFLVLQVDPPEGKALQGSVDTCPARQYGPARSSEKAEYSRFQMPVRDRWPPHDARSSDSGVGAVV
jgi:hypothetical protein